MRALHRGVGWAASALLLAVAAVHLDLYFTAGYRYIPTIGWLFLLTAAVAVVLALILAVRPSAPVVAAAGLFCLGVLGGYVLSLVLPDGIFQFRETGVSVAGIVAIVAESGVALLAAGVLWSAWWPRREQLSRGWRSRPATGRE